MIVLTFGFLLLHLTATGFFAYQIIRWKSKAATTQPGVAVIIAARNERKNLEILIPQLLSQDYPDFQIIVSLDRCEDHSIEYLNSIEDERVQWLAIKEVPQDWNSKKYALNEGIKRAKKEWLFFTDADCVPKSDKWMASLAKEIDATTNVLVGVSPYLSNQSFLSYYIAFEAFMTQFLYCSMHQMKRPYMAVGRNMGIRKAYFEEVGGYESIKSIKGGDDDLFVQKATKTTISLVLGHESIVYTYPEKSWRGYLHQKLRHLSVGSLYDPKDILAISAYHLMHLGTYLLSFMLLPIHLLLPIILFYLVIKLVIYRFVVNKNCIGFNYVLFPVVDILYAFIIPIIGMWSKAIKDIEWKN